MYKDEMTISLPGTQTQQHNNTNTGVHTVFRFQNCEKPGTYENNISNFSQENVLSELSQMI